MQGHSADSNPEELLDVFKAAALSVTKLFKTSTAAQSKARVDGYQDCLEDLLAVLDKGDADVRSIRRWVLERLDGRESMLSTIESEDEVEKTDGGSTPEPNNTRHAVANGHHGSNRASAGVPANVSAPAGADTPMQTSTESEMDTETEAVSPVKSRVKTKTASATSTVPVTSAHTLSSTAPVSAMAALAAKKAAKAKAKAHTSVPASAPAPAASPEMTESADGSVPMQTPEAGSGDFSFRSAVPYPTDSFLELANLDLSDRRSVPGAAKEQSDSAALTTPSQFSSASSNTTTPSSTTFIFNAPANNTSENSTVSTPARQFRVRHGAARTNGRNILTARYNRSSAGQKRKLNFDEIFDVASLGYGKDVFSRGGPKRSRQT
ncbi:hypothetical protein F503_01046 [Ophiostoma piceae UAMH 11346]|uniref:Uncharacterized protein n=1 Tax=Ophiostoma piceae (strain UAMH 11346) TaxID=1262450 RepID=S3CP07_OPHP1|nr:hypothetical protein F503_01046 [Ophiostoma piceae UAMH 11346]